MNHGTTARWSTAARHPNNTYGLLHKLDLLQQRGCLKTHRYGQKLKLFRYLPRRLAFNLRDLVSDVVLQSGHVFLGFTKDGQFVLSYTMHMEADNHTACPSYVYHLQWWQFIPYQPLKKVSEVRLFGEQEILQDLRIAVCQWPHDNSKILVYGSCCSAVPDMVQCYITITATPPLTPCADCAKQRENDNTEDATSQDLNTSDRCFRHGFTMHTKYLPVPPYPLFHPTVSMKKDGMVLFNTGDNLIALHVWLNPEYDPAVDSVKEQYLELSAVAESCSSNSLATFPLATTERMGNKFSSPETSGLPDSLLANQHKMNYEWCSDATHSTKVADAAVMRHISGVHEHLIQGTAEPKSDQGEEFHFSTVNVSSSSLDASLEQKPVRSLLDNSTTQLDESSSGNFYVAGSPVCPVCRIACASSMHSVDGCHKRADFSNKSQARTELSQEQGARDEGGNPYSEGPLVQPGEKTFIMETYHGGGNSWMPEDQILAQNNLIHNKNGFNNAPSKILPKSVIGGLLDLCTCTAGGCRLFIHHLDEASKENVSPEDHRSPGCCFCERKSQETNGEYGDSELCFEFSGPESDPPSPIPATVPNIEQVEDEKSVCVIETSQYFVHADVHGATTLIDDNPSDEDAANLEYNSNLPLEVHGACYTPMRALRCGNIVKGTSTVMIRQLTFDIEQYAHEMAQRLCAEAGKKYLAFNDYDVQIIDLCSESGTALVLVLMLIQAAGAKKDSSKANRNNDRFLYQTGFKFVWNINTGTYNIVDTEELQELGHHYGFCDSKSTLWNPAQQAVQRLQKQWIPPQSPARSVNVLTNDAVIRGKSLQVLWDSSHCVAIIL